MTDQIVIDAVKELQEQITESLRRQFADPLDVRKAKWVKYYESKGFTYDPEKDEMVLDIQLDPAIFHIDFPKEKI